MANNDHDMDDARSIASQLDDTDGVILDNLRFFKSSSPDTPVILASNDNDLCSAARRLGALDIAVLDLGAFL